MGQGILIGRQPILDRQLRTQAYELLHRGPASPPGRGTPKSWTASIVADGLTELGLDALVGARTAYLNVSAGFLLDVDPLPFSPERVVLELTEDSHRTEPRLLARLLGLRETGFVIALDDFVYEPGLAPLVELADLVKLDVLALGPERLAAQVGQLAPFEVELLAEKVETAAEYDHCRALGFSLFQGYFFARPRLVSGHGLPAGRLTTLGTLAELTAPDVGFGQLEAIVARDLGLSYKLLRYVNSSFFGLPRRVSTVRDAMTLLGSRAVRQWALVITLAGATAAPPQELIALALMRAKLCEALAAGAPDADAHFTAGLFSLVDALIDLPLREVLGRLPLDLQLTDALLERSGPIGDALDRVIRAEHGEIEALAGLPRGADGGAYAAATAWADRSTAALA